MKGKCTLSTIAVAAFIMVIPIVSVATFVSGASPVALHSASVAPLYDDLACNVCNPPDPKGEPMPLPVWDPKAYDTLGQVPCLECAPRPNTGEPMPWVIFDPKKEPTCLECDPPPGV